MAYMGTWLVLHDNTYQLIYWGHHGTPAWFIGPSLKHYRNMKFYMPATGIKRFNDTLKLFPKAFKFTATTAEDLPRQAISEILDVIKDPPNNPSYMICSNPRCPPIFLLIQFD